MTPCKGTGQFQWNTGGWFGAQMGSTAYLVCLGTAYSVRALVPGIAIVLCGLLPNVIGFRMWKQRDRLLPYPAIQRLLLVIFAFTAIAVVVFVACEHSKT